MTTRTKQNLHTAMLNEALAYAKCTRFAACARSNENLDLAQLFQNTADTGRVDHFRKEFDLAALCSDDADNLKTAILDRERQIEMYADFAVQARKDGDKSAAELFERIRKQELTELAAFEVALANLSMQGNAAEMATA